MSRTFALAVLLAVATLPLTACRDAPTGLVFSVIPDQEYGLLEERADRLTTYLERTLGIDVRFDPVTAYPAAVAKLVTGSVQMCWFGGLTHVQAAAEADVTAIAQRDVDAHFQSVFVARAGDDTIPDLTDEAPTADEIEAFREALQGKVFSFGSQTSTSGRLMPQHFLETIFDVQFANNGTDPAFVFSSSHDNTALFVAHEQADVGAMNGKVWERAQRGDLREVPADSLRPIWITPEYYDYNWTVRGDLDQRLGEGFRTRLQAALLAIDGVDDDANVDELEVQILADYGAERFIASENSNYDTIHDVARAAGFID